MVETILTKDMIEIGKVFVRKLDENKLMPVAALWFYFTKEEQWKLIIVEYDVATLGPKEIYRKIQQILVESRDELSGLSLDDVALDKPDAPIISLLRVAIKTGPEISGIRFKNNVINGTLIQDAYIYRMT